MNSTKTPPPHTHQPDSAVTIILCLVSPLSRPLPFVCWTICWSIYRTNPIHHIISFPPANILENKSLGISCECCGRIWFVVCDWTGVGSPKCRKAHGHLPASGPFSFFLPPSKGNSVLRNLNIILMIAKTVEEKWHVIMRLWVAT